MKCFECGGEMKSWVGEDVPYNVGLPDVRVSGLELRKCLECGEETTTIFRILALHMAIAQAVIAKPSRLTAAEVKFLRKVLGWSSGDFARHMGVRPESVSRWENNKEPIGPQADRLLRLMVATREPVSEYPLETLAELKTRATPARIRAARSRTGWHAERLTA